MRIPLSAPDITDSDVAAVTRVLRGSRLSLGPVLGEFEREVAKFIGSAFAVGVNSGTSALHIAIRALRIGAGDEVVLPSFSFIAPANAIRYERAIPVFVEIDPATLALDPAKVRAAITPRTRAILVVHTFGCPAEMPKLLRIAREHHLFVLEDACEAFGAELNGRRVGAFGDVGLFAFYPNKQITTGEGGMAVTDDPKIASRMRALRNQGRGQSDDWFQHEELGYSYRLSEINSALGLEQLKRIESILAKRRAVALRYRKRLAENPFLVLPPADSAERRISWFTYPVRLSRDFTREDRDRIVKEMALRGVECGRYFAPVHLQPAYSSVEFRRHDLSLTESIASRCLALPLFNQITEAQVDAVCETLSDLLGKPMSRTA